MPTVFVVVLLSVFTGVGIAVWPSISAAIEEAGKPTRTVEFEGFLFDVPKECEVKLLGEGKEFVENGRSDRTTFFDLGNDVVVFVSRTKFGNAEDVADSEIERARFAAQDTNEAILSLRKSIVQRQTTTAKEVSAVESVDINGIEFGKFTLSVSGAISATGEFYIYRPSQDFELQVRFLGEAADTERIEAARTIVQTIRHKDEQ